MDSVMNGLMGQCLHPRIFGLEPPLHRSVGLYVHRATEQLAVHSGGVKIRGKLGEGDPDSH